jgi:hypothetical protein
VLIDDPDGLDALIEVLKDEAEEMERRRRAEEMEARFAR